MINTQKFLILIITLNFVMGMSTAIYMHTDEFTESTLNLYDQQQTKFDNTADNIQASNQTGYYTQGQYQQTAIDTIKLGRTILSLFWEGLKPIPTESYNTLNLTEKLIMKTLKYFQGLLYIILGLELFYMWYSRKAT